MNNILEVIEFKTLISETKGRFVMEKIYHGVLDESKTLEGGCVMWCVWNPEKNKWSKWHIRYFIVGDERYWSDMAMFRFVAADYRKYGKLEVVK